MTSEQIRRLRRRAAALFAVAAVAVAGAVVVPQLPPLPVLLGLVPEPVAAPLPAPTPAAFVAVDSGALTAAEAPQRPDPATGRARRLDAAPPKVERPAPATVDSPAAGSALPLLPPDETPRGRYHRVEPGDTAATIADAYGLDTQWAVYDANPAITDPDRPPVGAWLYIPHPTVAPSPRPRPGQPGWSSTPAGTAIVDGVWLELAACESSGDWAIDTGNGYYGGLQFTLDSWRMVGGAGLPNEAHPMEQIARADYLQRIQGWKAWPMCAEKLGLLAPGEGKAQVERARAARDGGQ